MGTPTRASSIENNPTRNSGPRARCALDSGARCSQKCARESARWAISWSTPASATELTRTSESHRYSLSRPTSLIACPMDSMSRPPCSAELTRRRSLNVRPMSVPIASSSTTSDTPISVINLRMRKPCAALMPTLGAVSTSGCVKRYPSNNSTPAATHRSRAPRCGTWAARSCRPDWVSSLALRSSVAISRCSASRRATPATLRSSAALIASAPSMANR